MFVFIAMSILGSIGGIFNDLSGVSSSMATAQKYNREMFDRQLEASNTAHQREVADMLAAGLNPVLSASGGSGASTPTASGQSGGSSGLASIAAGVTSLAGIAQQITQASSAKASADATNLLNEQRRYFWDNLTDTQKQQAAAMMFIPRQGSWLGELAELSRLALGNERPKEEATKNLEEKSKPNPYGIDTNPKPSDWGFGPAYENIKKWMKEIRNRK